MKSVSKAQDRFQADVVRGGHDHYRSRLRGLWSWQCHAPFRLTDPAKGIHLLGDAGIIAPPNLSEGFLWMRQWWDLRSVLYKARPSILAEFERLVFGGELRWAEAYSNLIVNAGLDDMLDKFFKGSAYTAAHYIGLTDGTPTPAGSDTMSSHPGWAEVTAYSEGVRQTYTPGTVSAQSVDNSASKAVFSINATTTVGGGFLTTNSTKGGTTGTLIAVGAFSGGDKSLGSGDSLSITATFTQADDGI